MSTLQNISKEQVYEWLSAVTDPEVPVLTIQDLGIVRDIELATRPNGEPEITVIITPTYSGCPAMDVIAMGIRMMLASKGFRHIKVEHRISPAWTTDWMTEEGKRKLEQYGIAPPIRKAVDPLGLFEEDNVPCPRCHSTNTLLVSQFGPTSCKALYKCQSCHEPFEHFKCH